MCTHDECIGLDCSTGMWCVLHVQACCLLDMMIVSCYAALVCRPGAHFIVRECAGQINMLLSSLVFGKQHFISVPNAPYMDPSPSILKLWKANLGQQMIANGKCSATGPVGLPSSMPPAVTLQAVAPSAAVGGYGGSNAGVGVVVDAASMVERKGSNGAREKHH